MLLFTFLCVNYEFPEHSHEPFLTSVRASLNSNNPAKIVDPVFGLLGNAAAAGGAGAITVIPPFDHSNLEAHNVVGRYLSSAGDGRPSFH